MSKVIFSLYIDIPEKDLDLFDTHILKENEISRNLLTKQAFRDNYNKLIECKKRYAEAVGAKFVLYEYNEDYISYRNYWKKHFPQITDYNIVNFYKLKCMFALNHIYDEVLYLDFDTIPTTNESFFERWDLSKGIALLNNNNKIRSKGQKTHQITGTIRSPSAKYYNAQAMLLENNYPLDCDVVNTAIIGMTKKHSMQLKYFHGIGETIRLMDYLKTEEYESVFPKNITKIFGYDNETIFSYKLKTTNTPVQWLDNKWHYFYDAELHIPKKPKIIHAINKRFNFCWRFYEKLDL